MKQVVTLLGSSLLAAIVSAQPARYTVTDLGKFNSLNALTNNGVISGSITAANGASHAAIWRNKIPTDISTPGLGGKNSYAWSINENGQVAGQAETGSADPNGEDFCGYKAYELSTTSTTCLPFLWQNGVMTPLLTLGGRNGWADTINNQGVAAGAAENTTRDPACGAPQLFQTRPVYWQNGRVIELPIPAGDTNGMVFGINDNGQMVGSSGPCRDFDPISATYVRQSHALLWQNGAFTDLGNLGGGAGKGPFGNLALSVNNAGQIVGHANLKGEKANNAFLWTQAAGMKDLGTLPGDTGSGALFINDKGQIVGVSHDADFNLRAVLWENGVPYDLNSLIDGKSGLTLQLAGSINARGEIIGSAVSAEGEPHAFLATPQPRTMAVASPRALTTIARQITLDGTASISGDGKPLTFQWSIPQGSPSASILQGTTDAPTVQFGQSHTVYTFLLTVTDSTGKSSTDVVTVNFQGY